MEALSSMIGKLCGDMFSALMNQAPYAIEFRGELEAMKTHLELAMAFLADTKSLNKRGVVLKRVLEEMRDLIYEADDHYNKKVYRISFADPVAVRHSLEIVSELATKDPYAVAMSLGNRKESMLPLEVKAKQKLDEKVKEKERSEEELAALEDSTFVEVMGEDYPGRVRGMGKGPTPSSYYASTSRSHVAHVKSIKVQQLQNEVQEMRRELKEKDDRVENLEKQVKEKDDRLEKLEEQVALLLQKVKKKSKQKRMFHVDK